MGRKEPKTPLIANAYAVIAADEQQQTHTVAGVATPVEFDRPDVRRTSAAFAHLPEAQGLTWNDDFFDDEDDLVAAFDLDYDQMESYYSKLGWVGYGATLFCPFPIFWYGCLLGVPCFLNQNVQWSVRSQHVAITANGITFVKERRPTCWGLACTDEGKTTKTIPFDQITDCNVREPAGATCCVGNVLYTVEIDTAGRREGQCHELTITGLSNPEAFKKLVWAMKRNNNNNFMMPPSVSSTNAAASLAMLDRGLAAAAAAAGGGAGAPVAAAAAGEDNDVAGLLRDIRDELRQHNEVLQSLKKEAPSAAGAATAPPAAKDDANYP